MAPSADPSEELTNPETGAPIDLDEVKFVSLVGNKLTVYLPEELEWYRGPDGERRAREIGGSRVNFQNGMYPPGEQSATYAEAKLLVEDPHYGDLFKIAAQEMDVEATGGEGADQQMDDQEGADEPQRSEATASDQVRVNGQLMSKAEAREQLGIVEEPTEGGANEAHASEATASDLDVLSGPNNRTEALEALAERGLDMSEAPPASATSEEIQRFAVEHGFVIEKYDLPD